MKISSFAVNEEAEIRGVHKSLGDGASILVARAYNDNYNKRFREEMEPYRSATGITGLSDEAADEIFIKVMAETILLGWEGLTDDDGNLVEYSVETAVEWLTKYKEFRKIVSATSSDIDNFRAKEEVEVKENLKK